MDATVRLILDTDIGDDVDDAFALALAALHPKISLAGVTTCWGDTLRRGRLARRVLQAAGAGDVKVFAGPQTSLSTGETVRNSFESGEGHIPDAGRIEAVPAVDFLVESVLSRPGQYVLCAIGPLTNVALAMRKHPRFAESLRMLVVMGGWLDPSDGQDDYNLAVDPLAAGEVLASTANLRIGPIDSTRHAVMNVSHRDRLARAGTDLARLLVGMFDQYLSRLGRQTTSMYDPATLSTVYQTDFARLETMALGLDERRAGVLISGNRKTEVIAEINGRAFIDHLVDMLAGPKLGAQQQRSRSGALPDPAQND